MGKVISSSSASCAQIVAATFSYKLLRLPRPSGKIGPRSCNKRHTREIRRCGHGSTVSAVVGVIVHG
eukprot:COSAG05_NODE_95_length_19507_cov_71.031791_4_plen_67_part_00